MKTFSKIIFLTLAASASADTIWAKLATQGEIEEASLYDAMEQEGFDAHGDGEAHELIYGTKKDKDDDKKDDKKKEKDDKKKDKDDKKKDKDDKKKDKDDKKKDKDDKDKDKEDRDESSSKSAKDPTRKPTKKPTGRSPSSSSSSKSTKKPTRKPTKRPSGRKPSRSSSSSSSSSSKSDKNRNSRSCRSVDDEKPSVSRSGDRYKFKLMRKDGGQCVDKNDDLYEYGRFDKVKDFSDCADACVKDVRSSLLDNFRGYDWDCDKERCLCLYDKGTLDSRNGGNFDRTNRDEKGKGDVKSTTKKSDYFCAKLDKVDLASDEFTAVRTGLRG